MSNSIITSDLVKDLSTQEQELLSGGRCCQWRFRRVCVRYCHTPLQVGRYGR